jgi:exopolysaccharide production protein ExoZ
MTHSNNQANSNLKSLQILRFIAATSVAYLHIYVNPNFGSFGVDIFFVLSGFVIALVVSNKQSAKVFAISRLARIVPLYWLLTTLLLFLIYFKPQYVHETTAASASLINYLKSLFFIPYYGASDMKPLLRLGWTLNYEMLFYLCVWIALLTSKRNVLLFSFVLLVICYYVFGSLSHNKIANEFFGSELIFEFILGVIAFKIFSMNKLKQISNSILLLTAIFAYGLMAFMEANEYGGNSFLVFGIPSFILVLSAVGLEEYVSESKNFFTSALIHMGDASYATYLTHWYVIVACRKIFSEKLGLFDFYSATGVCITLGIFLIVGQITFKYVDKPLNKNLKRYIFSTFVKPTQQRL